MSGPTQPVLLSPLATHPDSQATYNAAASSQAGSIGRFQTSATKEESLELGGSSGGGGGDSGGVVRSRVVRMPPSPAANLVEAAAEGAGATIPMVAAILTNLIGFVSLVHALDACVRWVSSLVNVETSATELLGYCFYPVALFIGVPLPDCHLVGQYLGTKLVLNEFVAYSHLGAATAAGQLSHRAGTVATYALCSFANLGSMGIMIGAISGIYPALRAPLVADVTRALAAGTIACLLTGLSSRFTSTKT